MATIQRFLAKLGLIAFFCLAANVAVSDDKLGIFELINQASGSYEDTLAAVASALEVSNLTVHARHEVRVPEQKQRAHVFILTSPDYRELAQNESPRTISAQVLRVAVYTWGDDQQTLINMANPVPHAMVFYASSKNYDDLVAGAKRAAADIRAALAKIPGDAVSIPQSPMRSERHYNKFKGDGPARMMAKFRTFKKSQLLIHEADAAKFGEVTETVMHALRNSVALDTEDPDGWDSVVQIPFGENAIYVGISSPYLEDKMIRINSRFRSDGKSDNAPYPGTDHVAALPTEVLLIKEDGKTKVLHYGQMWRMQLYFWDSGYRAFTLNVGVPAAISNSIEDLLAESLE